MIDISVYITSCNRLDLLNQTIDSFKLNNAYDNIKYYLTEDGGNEQVANNIHKLHPEIDITFNDPKLGLFKSVDLLYSLIDTEYVFGCEDDWLFDDTNQNFIKESLDILEERKDIHQVWIRKDIPNEWIGKELFTTTTGVNYNLVEIHHNDWCGYSLNPGLRRKSDYLKFFPNGLAHHINSDKPEVDAEKACNDHVAKLGYKAAILENRVITHLGKGRTTF